MRWTPSFKTALTTAFLFTLWMHVVILIVGGTFLRLVKPLPFYLENMKHAELIPSRGETGWYNFVQPLQRFDGLWYKEIALYHYSNNLRSTAFFPLFPFTAGFLMQISGLSFEQVSFVFNTVLTFIFFILLYFLAEKHFGKESAWQSVAIYAFFPTSFFLLAPYAETLLLVLLMVSLFLAYGKKYFLSCVFAALAAMTKPFGAFFIFPLIYIFYRSDKSIKLKLLRLSYLLLIPLAFVIVVLYQDAMSGVSMATFKSQSFWGIKYPSPLEFLVNIFTLFSRIGYDLPSHINLILAVGGIILLVAAKGIIRFELWLLSLVFLVIFLTTSTRFNFIPFFSFSRYFLMLFPLMIYATTLKVKPVYKLFVVGISIALFVVLFSFYTVGWFVA